MSTYVKSPLNTEIIMKWFKMALSSQLPLTIYILLHYTSIKGTAAGDGKEEHHGFNNSSLFFLWQFVFKKWRKILLGFLITKFIICMKKSPDSILSSSDINPALNLFITQEWCGEKKKLIY